MIDTGCKRCDFIGPEPALEGAQRDLHRALCPAWRQLKPHFERMAKAAADATVAAQRANIDSQRRRGRQAQRTPYGPKR